MIIRWRSSCAGHRAALLDFVDRRERGPGTDVALAHLDCCGSCAAELTEIALAITALRRLRAVVQLAEPSHAAWERVRRVAARRPAAPWRWRMSLGGTLVGAALAAVVVMPTAFGPLAAPSPLIAAGDAAATLDDAPAGASSTTRIYDPPAGMLTAGIVMILAGDPGIGRPRETRALTFVPVATDRFELDRAHRRAASASEGTPIRAATRD